MRCISVCAEKAKGMKKKGMHLCTLACVFCGRVHHLCLHEARRLITGRVGGGGGAPEKSTASQPVAKQTGSYVTECNSPVWPTYAKKKKKKCFTLRQRTSETKSVMHGDFTLLCEIEALMQSTG